MIDLSVVIVCRDDEEHIGHLVRRVKDHLHTLGLRFEILAVDEGSGDNTLALLALVRRGLPELEVVAGAPEGTGLWRGARLARGHAVLLLYARSHPPLSAFGFALGRLDAGQDIVVLSPSSVMLMRTRAWRAFAGLARGRDAVDRQRRFLHRATSLGLAVDDPAARASVQPVASVWTRLRTLLGGPLVDG